MAILSARLHASTRRDEPLSSDPVTGEVRAPIALYEVDERRGDLDLVLSRAEGQHLLTQLATALGFQLHRPAPRGLEAVR